LHRRVRSIIGRTRAAANFSLRGARSPLFSVRNSKIVKIAIVTPTIAKRATGPARWIATLTEFLCNVGYEVTVITADVMKWGEPEGETIEIDRRATTKVFPVSGWLSRRIYRATEMRKWLHRNVRRFDLVDIQGVWSFVAADAARACLACGVPYVITPHGQMARWDWEKRPWRKPVFFNLVLRRVWRAAAAVRFLSEAEQRNSVACAGQRAVVVPSWVTPPITAGDTGSDLETRASLGIPPRSPVVLFVGRISAEKGVVETIRAFERMRRRSPETILLLVGPVEPEYCETFDREIRRSVSRNAIRLAGPVYDEARKAALFRIASVFITLSKTEGLPIAVLEALGAGVPVVLTADSNLPEVIEYDAGIVTSAEPGAAADSIERLIDDPARLRQLRENARRLVREQFAPDAVLPKLLSLYGDVCARAATGGALSNGLTAERNYAR
jgi:glycosyltransferase involved in cell wall biosynthesis